MFGKFHGNFTKIFIQMMQLTNQSSILMCHAIIMGHPKWSKRGCLIICKKKKKRLLLFFVIPLYYIILVFQNNKNTNT